MPTIAGQSVDAMVRRQGFIGRDQATRMGFHVCPTTKKAWLRKYERNGGAVESTVWPPSLVAPRCASEHP
jgi:hypothetical protein